MPYDVSFFLLNRDGSYRCALPSAASWALSPIVHEAGGATLDYPVTGRNFDLLREHSDANSDVELAVWIDGEDSGLTVLLMADDSDDVDEAAVWTFSGHFGEVRLEDAVIEPRDDIVAPPDGPAPTEDVAAYRAYSATAGEIMRTLLLEANARGTLTDLDWSTFSNPTDSAGAAWSKVITLKIAPGVNYLEVAQALVSYDLCEFRMVGRSLRMFNPGTSAVDHTIGPIASQVVLRRGRDITDAPRKRSVREAATDLLIAGGEGLYRRVFDSTARARFGRQREQYRSVGSITDDGALLAYGGVEMQRVKDGKLSVTHGLAFANPNTPRPLIDFRPGDWVWSDTGRPTGLERLQAVQVTITGDSGGAQAGSASLNDLVASREAQLARRIKGIEGGSTLTGTSQARPVAAGPDTTVPKAPAGLGVDTEGFPGAHGGSWSVVTASWAPVLQNTDDTLIDDLDRYVVRWRYLSGQGLPTGWTVQGSPISGEVFAWSPVVSGVSIEVAVQAVDDAGNASAWSAPVGATTAADVTPPPVLSTPVTVSELGLLLAEWNGRGASNEVMPPKFSHAEVHVSTTTGFTPSDATYYDRLNGAGVMPIQIGAAGYDTTFYVKLVAVSRAGIKAAASAQSATVLARIADGEIAQLSIGKLVTGILTAVMTVSGIIRTASAGARVELDSAGLRCYSSTDAILFQFSIPSSALTVAGRLLAGAGIGVGPTIDVNPATASIDAYPNATGVRIRQRAFTLPSPDGGGNAPSFIRETLNAAGQPAGPVLIENPTVSWRTFQDAAGFYFGGLAKLYSYGSFFGFQDAGVDSYINFDNVGRIRFKGYLQHSDSLGGLGTFFVGFGDAGATTGIARSYGVTMQSSRSVFATMFGSNVHVYVSDSTLNSFTILRDSGTGGFIYFQSIGHNG